MLQKEIKKSIQKLVAILGFFALNSTLFSQTVLLTPSEKYIGTSHGVNTSMVLFNPSVDQNYLFLGYNAGISYRYITEKHFGLQLELKYSQRGWSESDGKYIRRINYLELPMLTHLYFGNTHRFIFNLGPKIGYMLNESVVKNTASNPSSEQYKDVYFPFDYGLTAGFGYNLHTHNAGVYEIELRGYYGLSDIFANSKSDYFSTSNYLNISLNLGWYFQLTGRK
ncbi:conserved hypothetical protein [uncultured Paludibacter sp.]|uniref:Outer membrane protein beta-barrel domain-containing protein n=1 Tax=uncultured Paludibacter sp. TaxID=497635 RepID=A0A653AKG9_9BACT|nr:conserved hypothetical protein [uncultured Paludibacter sp.]